MFITQKKSLATFSKGVVFVMGRICGTVFFPSNKMFLPVYSIFIRFLIFLQREEGREK